MRVSENLNASSDAGDIVNSGLVCSSQSGVHPRLQQILQRHLDVPWSQPLHRPSVESYRYFKRTGALTGDKPFILDSGCGTGKSTQKIASQYPGHLVIGVDRSQARLAKSGLQHNGVNQVMYQQDNCFLLRADLPTFWRLLARDGCIPHKHYLFYPNPWPKPGHLKRRWHGHPVFPRLLALGGEIEMRSNWDIYAMEFAQAAGFATGEFSAVQNCDRREDVSPFEQKYRERGQSLFSVRIPRQVTDAFRRSRRVE